MSKSRIGIVLAVLALALLNSGCYRAVRLERLGYEIADACEGARFKKDISLSLGGISWGILKSIAMAAEKDDPEVRMYVGSLDKIEIVVYKAQGISKEDARPIGEVVKSWLDDDWSLMVKTIEPGDMAWIHYREDKDNIREMQIAAYDGDEFVIVRLSGRLDDMMEMAVADHGGFTDKIVHHTRD